MAGKIKTITVTSRIEMDMMTETPVLIAGGGPVGMTLALHLAHYGVRSIVVERNPATTQHPKMDLTNGRSMELFKRIGLADKLREAGVPGQSPFDVSWITSLAGYELHRFHYPSSDQTREIIRTRNDGSQAREPGLRVSQIVIEPVLKRAIDANELIDVRFATIFERIVEQDEHGVLVELTDVKSGKPWQVRCQFLAGCDGGGSRVRRQIGIELDGEMAVAGAYMVHFRTQARDVLQRWGIAWHYQSGAGTIIAQNDKDIYTLQAWLAPGQDPAAMRPEDVLEGWVGRKFDYEILQANPWTANFVVAQRYVKGRVVLAGDSAHQFIPTGGYGMNSGVADAAGLSWVLAALIQGWGGGKLLQAYEEERRPTAWWHLEAARRHMGVRIQIGQVYLEAGDLEGQDAAAEARRAETGRKIAALGNAENESWGVELGYRYDNSPIIWPEASPPAIDPLTYKPSTWPGGRLPHVWLEDGVSIHDRLGLYLSLIAFADFDRSVVEAASAELGMPLTIVQLDRPDLRTIFARNFLLVRPDQHVAWRGDTLPPDFAALLSHVTGR
jgi:2-polyprenyl-6-methoxyphenol hydroxylase-like FAD-dependent oxidoreductase